MAMYLNKVGRFLCGKWYRSLGKNRRSATARVDSRGAICLGYQNLCKCLESIWSALNVYMRFAIRTGMAKQMYHWMTVFVTFNNVVDRFHGFIFLSNTEVSSHVEV